MQTILIKLQIKLDELLHGAEGQDMVEYALVLGLICFGAASASRFLAAGLAQTFQNISSNLGSYTG